VALTEGAQAMLEQLWMVRNPEEPRIFPYNAKTCSARHTLAKQALGLHHLRLHDSRRDQFTRLVEDEGRTLEEAILVSGHDSIAIPQRHYFSQKPEKFHTGRRLQIAPPAPMPLAA